MNQETVPSPGDNTKPKQDSSPLSPELLDKIKHPAKMDDVIREQSPEERRTNPALAKAARSPKSHSNERGMNCE
jgi:hypothetical protein